jgi:hypothetical protein
MSGCGCGGNDSASGGPLLSGVLTGQYAADAGGLALSNPPNSGAVAADVGATPGAVFTSGGFWIVVLFIGIAAFVVDGARRKNE